MDKREAIKTAQSWVDGISKKYQLTQAFVFGSYAKGNYGAHSDIDVAVVIKDVNNLFDAQVDLLRLRKDKNLMIEPHPFRDADFDTDDPFVNEIAQGGVRLQIS
jgi:predicted nucleotidyltransferase